MKDDLKKLRRTSDLWLIGSLLIAALALLLWQRVNRTEGTEVSVYVDNVCVARYPLQENRTETLYTEDGSSYNILVIENGTARVTEAGCPDRICVKTGVIRYNGESITCLPNHLTVVVEGGEGGVDIR